MGQNSQKSGMVGHSTEFSHGLGHKEPRRPRRRRGLTSIDSGRGRSRVRPDPGDSFPPLAISRIITPRIARAGVPHLSRRQRHRVIRAAYESVGRVEHDPPSRGRRRHSRADRQSHVPRDRHNRLSLQWRRARTRAGNGGAREPAQHQALRPHEGAAHAGRGGEDQALIWAIL